MKKSIICIVLFIFASACTDNIEFHNNQSSQLIVEGWIEDGGFPVVILTRTLPVFTEYQNVDSIKNYLLRWAKVTISDGRDSVVLTGKYDPGYFPPYIYTSSRIKGVAGREYKLSVEYQNYHATAITSIPYSPDYCSFKVEQCNDIDTLYQIKAKIQKESSEGYYQFFTRVGTSSKQYYASYLGSVNSDVINSDMYFPVYRGQQLKSDRYTPYFCLHDTISVKLAHIDEISYRFWDSYIQTLSLSSNMFLSTSNNIKSNIKGGNGYWCGYGVFTHNIVIKDSIITQN